MPDITVFVSPKGGSGATFICAGVWNALLEKSHKVLALDACFDKCALDYALGFQSDYVYTAADVINGDISLEEAVCTHQNGSFLRWDYEKDTNGTQALMNMLKAAPYDYVLIDAPADCVGSFFESEHAADRLVFVTEPTLLSVKMCDRVAGMCGVKNSFVVINKIIPSYTKAGVHLTADEVVDGISCPPIGLVPWSPYGEIALKQGFKFPVKDARLKEAFSNIATRISGSYAQAMDFKKVYDCFKLGRSFELMSD